MYVPGLIAVGVVLGPLLGYALGIGLTLLLPATSTVRGPDGRLMSLPTDNTGVPVLTSGVGLLVGLGLAIFVATQRVRRHARR